MDNVIPPLTPPNLNAPTNDKVVTGELETVPEVLQNIRPTEGLLLKFIGSMNTATLSGSVKLNLSNSEIEVPLRLNLDSSMDFPEGKENQAIIRLSGADNSLLKIISVNNENPGKYLAMAPQPNVKVPTAPLIMDTGNILKGVSLRPLDLTPILENIIKDVNLPPEVLSAVREQFSGSRVSFKLQDIVSSEAGLKDLPKIDKAITESIGRLKLILSGLARQGSFDAEAVDDTINNIKNEIQPLRGMLLSGEAVNPGNDRLAGIKTIIGNILADNLPGLENGAKIPEGTKLLLEIKDFIFPEKAPADNLEDLLSSKKLIENLPGLKLLQPGGTSPEKPVIMKLLDNLRFSGNADLSAKIMDKIPSDNAKMLSNMVNFMKGALHNDPRQWLGADLIKDLEQGGAEGKEAAARLNNFMASSVREGAGWRQVEIPFFSGENLSKIKVAVRQNDEEDNKPSNPKKMSGTRFVVDTTFSNLGNFQFDGFAVAADKRFDLVIRTSKTIEDSFYANILRLFKTTLFEFDYSGNIKLNVKENFIKVCEDETSKNSTIKTGIYI